VFGNLRERQVLASISSMHHGARPEDRLGESMLDLFRHHVGAHDSGIELPDQFYGAQQRWWQPQVAWMKLQGH
jgi:hypothetical protein